MISTSKLQERLRELDAQIQANRAQATQLQIERQKLLIALEVVGELDKEVSRPPSTAGPPPLPPAGRAITGYVIQALKKGKSLTKRNLISNFAEQDMRLSEEDLDAALERLVTDGVVELVGRSYSLPGMRQQS